MRFCNKSAVGAFEKVLVTLMQEKEKVIVNKILCQKIGKHLYLNSHILECYII